MEQAIDWKWTLARGIFGIIFGFAVLVFPDSALLAIAFLFGFYVTLDGIIALSSAWAQYKAGDRWGFFALEGVLGLFAGLGAVAFPGLALYTLLILMSAWALITGLLELYAGFTAHENVSNSIFLVLAGIVSLIFGGLILARPGAGAAVLVLMTAVYSIAFGLMFSAWALQIRRRSQRPSIGSERSEHPERSEHSEPHPV
jgi:uncharacterized membrane protein HdeD (DUF308 family)